MHFCDVPLHLENLSTNANLIYLIIHAEHTFMAIHCQMRIKKYWESQNTCKKKSTTFSSGSQSKISKCLMQKYEKGQGKKGQTLDVMRKFWERPEKVLWKSLGCPGKVLSNFWEFHEKVMTVLRKSWESPEKILRKLWEICEKFLRNSWESPESAMRKAEKVPRESWESFEKVLGKSWEIPEKVLKVLRNF